MTRKTGSLYLLGIMVFAVCIFFFRLGEESLLTDEYLSLHVAQQPIKYILFSHNTGTNPNTIPFLYDLILHVWLRIFGATPFAQRSLSALFGVLSVLILYKLVETLFDKRTALLSALFSLFSYNWFCFFRQNRAYSLFMLLTLVSFYLYLRFLKSRSRPILFALTIANIALVYSHYFGFMVVGLEILFVVLEWKRHREAVKYVIFMGIWVALSFLPWGENFLFDLSREPLMNSRAARDFQEVMIDVMMLVLYDFHAQWEMLLSVPYIILIVRGLVVFRKERSPLFSHRLVMLWLIFLIPFVTIYFLVFTNRIRYYSPFYFPFIIFLALGAQRWNLVNAKRIAGALCLFVPVAALNITDLYDFYSNPMNENWKEAAEYVKSVPDYRNKNMVFVFQTIYNPSVFGYYFWGEEIAHRFVENMSKQDSYERDLSEEGIPHKVYVMEDLMQNETSLAEKLETFPEDAFIWVFCYHKRPLYTIQVRNRGKYFIHAIILNKELPQIDFFLLRKSRGLLQAGET